MESDVDKEVTKTPPKESPQRILNRIVPTLRQHAVLPYIRHQRWSVATEEKEYTPVCVHLQGVEGLFPPRNTGPQNESKTVEYQLSISLYDLNFRHFFGRQWIGPYTSMNANQKKPKLKYNQNVYFHTSLGNASLAGVVEAVATVREEDGKQKKSTCAWGLIRIFKSNEDLPDFGRASNLPVQKIQMFYGTPRALFFMEEPIESDSNLKPIPDCVLSYTLGTHKALLDVMNLIPENVIVASNDMIPGLQESQTPGKDQLKKPKSMRKIACQLEHVNIQLLPTVDKFEEELSELLHKDRVERDGRATSGTQVTIVERRLLVGVHNGWGFLDKPQIFHLDLHQDKSKSLKPTASPSVRRSKKFQQSSQKTEDSTTFLTLQNKIELGELLEDPMVAITFTLEYVIGEPLSEEDRKVSSCVARGNTRTVSIRWAAWNPFLAQSSYEIRLALNGGPSPAPDEEFIYKLPDTKMQHENVSKTAGGILAFSFSFLGQNEGYGGMPSAAMLGPGGMMSDGMMQGMSGMMPAGSGFMPGSMASMQSGEGSDMMMDSSGLRKPPSGRSPSGFGMYANQGAMAMRRPSMASVGQSECTTTRTAMDQTPGSGPMSLQVPQMMPQGGMSHQQQLMQQQQQQQQQMMMQQGMGPQGGMSVPQMYPPGPQGYMMHPQQSMYGPQQGMYGMEISHMSMSSRQVGMSTEMNELPFTPVHAPIVVQPHANAGAQGLSRAAYARLFNAGFEPILDRNSEPPEVIDPRQQRRLDLSKENSDPLQCNEIVFQFLAFSKMMTFEATGPKTETKTVFFTFQFYRCPQVTTERMMLAKPENELSSDRYSVPYILQKIQPDGNMTQAPPGMEVRYHMDPACMKPGENALFLKHLFQQVLHIDVWDGDTLLLMGSCAVQLKYLCRCGSEAVQTTFELDVITTEYENDPNIVNSNINQVGGLQAFGVKTYVKGKLHLRMANIGQKTDPKSTLADHLKPLNTLLPHMGGKKKSESQLKKVARAKHVADKNHEVQAMLMSHKDQMVPEKDTNREGDAEKNRKLSRIHAVRQAQGIDNKVNTIMSYKTEKSDRMRDYKTIEIYRLQTKKDGIMSMLSQTISTNYTVHPSFGSSEFFEYVFKNPFNVQQTITVEFDDKELHVVTDPREWRYFKRLYELQGEVEEGMFNKQSKAQYVEIFLRPKETVQIPFKYLTFTADESVQPQGPVDPFKQKNEDDEDIKKPPSQTMNEKSIKVYFKNEDGKPVSILNVNVEPQPHIIDQTFRFYHPEQSFLKKSIRMPPFQSLPGAPVGGPGLNQVFVRCSNSHVICDSKSTQPGEPTDVFLKVAMGPSPQSKRFFVAMYFDPFMARPVQIWQFYVHALQRVDVACVEGQTSRFDLLLRGTQASRLVRCYSSHPNEMQMFPGDQFMLTAGAVHEMTVAVRPMKEGNKFFYINIVDVEYHQLIRSWLVCVTCRPPMVSRSFDVVLPMGGGKGCSKRIPYTNPYPHKKVFVLLNNREDLLQFRESRLEIEGGETQTIGLRFTPVTKAGSVEVMVFINDEDDKNEETFKITATYQ
ncbi:nephrocystin-4-like isoform X2 [Mizuhopecten yessoensis]|uniref:nephrocystin-4-like isoform X2 n=1 Tax=Mizuhopecten yessoensis TaxID=6573 RepID=UPI000B4579C1|nr:nephrocystin-4-like isoform X2 [Mizuhopecten yessoensis]